MSHLHVRRLVLIRQEYEALQSALNLLSADPSVPQPTSLQRGISNLENTYLIRLFTEYEGTLRDYLDGLRPQRRVPRTAEGLIDRVAGMAHVPDPTRLAAHDVRLYRNAIVHAGALTASVVSFRSASGILSRYLSVLPD